MQAFAPLFIFAAVLLGVFGLYSVIMDIFMQDQRRLEGRFQETFKQKTREKAKKTSLFKDLGKLAAEAQQGEPGIREKFEAMIEQSGLDDLTSQKLISMSCVGMGLLGVLGFLVYGLIGALVAAAIGFIIPIWYVNFQRNSRINTMRRQLPDVFDLMSRVVRAGQTMTQAMQAVTEEMGPPIALEFGLCYEQMNLGIPPEAALRDLARRTGIIELQIFVMGLLIQRQTGGNLAELLDGISAVIRDRFRILGEIQSLTAEGRMQAMVLLGMPPGMFLIMMVMNPKYAMELLNEPILLVIIFVSECFGALVIRKIVNFDF